MDNLWAWFKRANAKAVLGAGVAVLIVVTAWWTWKTVTPIALPTPAFLPATPAKAPPPLGLLAYIEAERNTKPPPTVANLFVLPDFLKPAPPQATQPSTQPQATQPQPALAAEPKPKPPQKRDLLDLKYKGMYLRSDGVLLALLEDSKSRGARYYPAGTNVFGFILSGIKAEEMILITADGKTNALKRGVNARFTDGKMD